MAGYKASTRSGWAGVVVGTLLLGWAGGLASPGVSLACSLLVLPVPPPRAATQAPHPSWALTPRSPLTSPGFNKGNLESITSRIEEI